MKKLCVLLPLCLLVLFAGTNSAQETGKSQEFFPESTRKKLIEEFSNHPDLKDYPNFVNHVVNMIKHRRHRLNVDERVAKLLGGNGQWAIRSSVEDLREYFQACSDDGLTMLRTMGAFSSLWRKTNTLNYMDGRDVNRAVEELNLSTGLALPIKNLRLFAYIPNADRAKVDKEYQCDILSVYDKKYKHRFRDEVLNANLKIGTGDTAPFVDIFTGEEGEWTGYLIKGILSYSDDNVGFMEINGIGGEKRGFIGFLQKILFFLPDAIDAMTLDKDGNMTTIALINETVYGFEKDRKYQVHRIGELPWEQEMPSLQKNE
jgi:hypothetical protein